MQQAVEQRGDAGALGKTSFHSLKGLLVVRISDFCSYAGDNLVEQVGRLVVEGEIPYSSMHSSATLA